MKPTRLFVVVAALVVVVGCSSNGGPATAPPVTTTAAAGPKMLFIGSGITVGDRIADPLRNAWPRLVFTEAFPPGAIFVNAATRQATFASAVNTQLPIAENLHPDVAFVWLGTNDLYADLTAGEIENAAKALLAGLRSAGATRIYVGGMPNITNSRLPTGTTNAAIRDAAAQAGATFVDLGGVRVAVESDGDVIPTKPVHRAVATEFEHALTR